MIAALYDIHGNLPALDAVLAEVREANVDQLIIGGDVIPGPMPRECLDALAAVNLPTSYILGNGDRECVAATRGAMSASIPAAFRDVMQWNADQLTPADVRSIDQWPATHAMQVDGIGRIVFCHATPRNDVEIFTAVTAEEKLRKIFDPIDAALVVCGHTHMQFDRTIGRTRVVNAGSVGMPFENPGAYWLLIDEKGPRLQRTSYDLHAAADRVRGTAYPQAQEFAEKNILAPPARAAMEAMFNKAELE